MILTKTIKTAVAVLLLLAVGFAITLLAPSADATTQGNCTTFYRHSGFIPGSYDYALFYEDGQLVTQVETQGQDTFVDPQDYDAGSRWDRVDKCHYPPTTTTTTTVPPTTTTTEPPATTTTTQPPSTTTTQPPDTTTTTEPPSTTTTSSPETTTTTEPGSTTAPSPSSTLPFTGPATPIPVSGLILLGSGLLALGGLAVRSARGER